MAAAPCGHFATLVRSTCGLRGFPSIHFVHLRRIPLTFRLRGFAFSNRLLVRFTVSF